MVEDKLTADNESSDYEGIALKEYNSCSREG